MKPTCLKKAKILYFFLGHFLAHSLSGSFFFAWVTLSLFFILI